MKAWKGTTYGNAWMHRWLIRLLRHTDVRVFYVIVSVLIIPVVLLFNPSRRTSYRYFRHRLSYGRFKAARLTYVNHCLFAQVVIDKFAMYAGKRFKVETDGEEHFRRLAARPEGFVMLSAHIGNYELAGYSLSTGTKRLNALVFGGEKDSVMWNRNRMFEENGIRMIPVRADMSHLFTLDSALRDGEIVSMPADRIGGSQKNIELELLGAKAKFPLGPFAVATARQTSALMVSVVKVATLSYKAYITPLHYDTQAASRREQIQQLAQTYVLALEKSIRAYPEQWYNFYDFWT